MGYYYGACMQRTAEVPDAVFAAVEAVPLGVPRVFVSHQPITHFEYLLTAPGTRVAYVCVCVL